MSALTADELYEREIKSLPANQRLRLMARIAADLADTATDASRPRSILELEGIAEANPVGMDAQEYISRMRDEWDRSR